MNFKKRVNGSWVDTPHYIHKTDTDTITTLPTVIYPTDTTATVGLKGQTLQSSIPSPTSPVIPQGTGERTGNLWDNSSTISKGQSPSYYTANFGTPLPAGTYTFSAKVIGEEGVTACRVSFRKSNMGQIVASNIDVSPERTSITVTLNEPCYAVYMYGSNDTTTLAAATYQDIMLNTGSSPLPYEPFGVKIPISSAGQTTPAYLGEVETTRKVKKLVLTGDEASWNEPAEGIHRLSLEGYMRENSNIPLCTHYIGIAPVSAAGDVGNSRIAFLISASGNNYMYIRDSAYTSITSFKSYLAQQYAAGTPVTVWYVLATPTTGIVNEPLRKIGDYADTISGITIPTITGKDTFDVLTTLKPSEVSLSYTGWHDASVKEYDGSQWNE